MASHSASHSARSFSRRTRRTVPFVIAGVVLLASAACASDDRSAGGSAPPTAAPVDPTRSPTPTDAPTATTSPPTTTTPSTTVAPTSPTAAPTSTDAPTTTAAPATTAPPTTTPAVNDEHVAVVNDVLARHQAAGDFVGARIAVRGADGSVTTATSGTETLEPGSAPVDLDEPWAIGSVTKTFVAVVVLQLVDEGEVELDEPIARFFPGMADAERITVRQLLQHTSGLGDYIDQPAVIGDAAREWAPEELVAVAEAAGRAGEPGGAHHYSNTNYVLLGEIIEQVTGETWSEEVRSRVVEPLGLESTGPIVGSGAPGWSKADGAFVPAAQQHPSIGGAGGGMQSTPMELLVFTEALMNGALLSADSHTAMLSLVAGDDLSEFGLVHQYGLGVEQYSNDVVTVVGHLGSGHVHSAFVGYDAERGNVVVVTMNTDTPGPQALMALETLMALAR